MGLIPKLIGLLFITYYYNRNIMYGMIRLGIYN